MDIRSIIHQQFTAVAELQHKILPPLTDDLALLESGLDSISFAQIVTQLEDRFGACPFTATTDIEFPETLGDFIAIFEAEARQGRKQRGRQ